MNSGTWVPGTPEERAGIYFRFVAAAQKRMLLGERGTSAIHLKLGWGEPHTFIEITGPGDIEDKLLVDRDDPSVRPIAEALKRSSKVMVYRLTKGTKAEGTLGEGKTVKAKFPGEAGNRIRVSVIGNPLDPLNFEVITYLGDRKVNTQNAAKMEELRSTRYVDFEGTGELVEVAGITLSGGTSVEPTTQDYSDYMLAAESEYFDTIGLQVTDEALKTTFVSYIRKLREDYGIKVQGVLSEFDADYEGIINVMNGVKLADGTNLEAVDAVPWVTGSQAGATLTQSLTFVQYEGAVDAYPRLDDPEIRDGIKQGHFMFTYDPRDKDVTVEADINSLVTLDKDKSRKFQKNKIIRIIDAINNDIFRELKALIKERKDMGMDIPTNGDGAQFVKTIVTVYMNELQEVQAIKNFDSQTDVTVTITDEEDGFIIDTGVQPVDSGEKYYFGMEVR